MSRTDTPARTPSPSLTTTTAQEPTMTSTPRLSRLMTLTALLTLVLTTALPLGEALTSRYTPPIPAPPTPAPRRAPGPPPPLPLGEALTSLTSPTTTTTASPTQTTPSTPTSPRPSKADRAAAHHDGCRQQTSTATGTLLARPSCRSGMPVTRDRGLAQVPPQVHDDQGPVAPNEVPPAWSGHWRQAAHSPYHRSQA